MHKFSHQLFRCRDQALQAAHLARRHLIRLLDHGAPELAAAMAEVTNRQAYANWWTSLTDHIEHGGQDPMTALTNARTAARQALLDLPTPRHACPFTHSQALAALEATRRFYHDTAPHGIDAITDPQPPAPDAPSTARPE